MRLLRYSSDYHGPLMLAVNDIDPNLSIAHPPFLKHYYTGQPWCTLFLAVDGDRVCGIVGVESMPFVAGTARWKIGFGSNFYSLISGVGGLLFLQWLRSCPYALVFGGSRDTKRIVTRQGWKLVHVARLYRINRTYINQPYERAWRAFAKGVLRRIRRTALLETPAPQGRNGKGRHLQVREEDDHEADMFPSRSDFAMRLAPDVDYLRWRYATGLSFVRYRIFRILEADRSVGYVVLNDGRERVTVAHSDAEDAEQLAYGMVLACIAVTRNDAKPRELMIAASHPVVQQILVSFGLRPDRRDRMLAIGRLRGRVDLPSGHWLINAGWGDNDLRRPFLDETI
ncbi:MAG: hypothetical protein P8X82_08690 [Gemmatimonadales bacterium]